MIVVFVCISLIYIYLITMTEQKTFSPAERKQWLLDKIYAEAAERDEFEAQRKKDFLKGRGPIERGARRALQAISPEIALHNATPLPQALIEGAKQTDVLLFTADAVAKLPTEFEPNV